VEVLEIPRAAQAVLAAVVTVSLELLMVRMAQQTQAAVAEALVTILTEQEQQAAPAVQVS